MKQAEIFAKRRAGILLHVSSLPSGTMGADAYRFVDFLQKAGVTIWQMLPLGPTHGDGSPYQCLSAHAGSGRLICMETIKSHHWIDDSTPTEGKFSSFIALAHKQFMQNASDDEKTHFYTFCEEQGYWLEDYVLFQELRHLNHATAWFDWPEDHRDRDPIALAKVKNERREALSIRRFQQYQFFEQWQKLRLYANERGVKLFGDMPIFVAHDSADVWAKPGLFSMDETGQPIKVAGVPPDYFSETGQRWGNPLYDWQKHIDSDFKWWQQRLQTQLALFDLVRIDHFRGFEACWEIPAECETAIEGTWVKAPGQALFNKLLESFEELPLVAEDLGIITDEVNALREEFGMPGMKILQFAFGGGSDNPYLPHNQSVDSVTYTGTHDNNTTLGWYNTLEAPTKQHVHEYLGNSTEPMPWLLIRATLSSISQMAIVPLQDILSLDGEHRMNVPGTVEGNWKWRFEWDMFDDDIQTKVRNLNQLYGRC